MRLLINAVIQSSIQNPVKGVLPMRLLFAVAALFFAMPAVCAFAAVPPLLPMEDFFRNPTNAAFSISPDGTKLAFARPWEHRM